MSESIINDIKNAIKTSKFLYNQLLIVVGESRKGKTSILKNLCNELGIELINLNLLISNKMLDLTEIQRALQLPKLLDELAKSDSELLILDNLEILFDINLKQDPLKLLQNISRNKTVIVSWNGRINDCKLTYAECGHPEYRSYEIKDLLIIDINNVNNYGLEQTAKEVNN